MGDYSPFQLQIHSVGNGREALEFANFIANFGLGQNWDSNHNGTAPTELYLTGTTYGDSDASTGIYEDATALAAKVPNSVYVAWTDPKYEWLGTIVIHVPGLGVFTADCNADGQPVMSNNALQELIDQQPDDMTIAEFREVLGKATGQPWFDAIEDLPEDRPKLVPVPGEGDIVEGGDGYASHGDCDPDDATPTTVELAREDDSLCWICGEPLDEDEEN